MSLKAEVRRAGDVSVIDLAGRITLGEGSGLVRSTIKDWSTPARRISCVNLKDVNYIDSAGSGRVGRRLRHRHQHGRQHQAAAPAGEGPRSPAGHQALHGLHRLRR